jgi:pSer/pThr/pTyr-binding forkhead associated (FHA) protein
VQINLTIRRKGDPHSYTVPCDLTDRIVFGRNILSPAQFEGSEISREHFALFLRQKTVYIEDLSANGTLVNDKPVPQGRSAKLDGGDVIGIPGYEIDLDLPQEPSEFVQSIPTATAPTIVGKRLSPFVGSFSFWELTIIGSALASFALILYYVMR